MKLSDVLTGRTKNEDTARLQKASSASSHAAAMNRQIKAMVPGQTIQGEVVSRNGGEVQLRLAEDFILNARVDQNMNIEVGQNMTFEVKNNGSTLTLSPLFANVSTDVNVLKALDMAGISVNQTSVAMTEQMMEAGLPIDRSSIQQLYREINAFPDAEISDIVNLHKLGIPVNEENVHQMIAYRNLNHQLLQGMDTIMETIPNVVEKMTLNGDPAGAAKLWQELLHMVRESGPAEDIPLEGALQGTGESMTANAQEIPEGEGMAAEKEAAFAQLAENGELQTAADGRGLMPAEEKLQGEETGQTQQISQELRTVVAEELRQVLSHLKLTPQESAELARQIEQFAQGASGADRLFAAVEGMLEAAGREETGGRDAMQLLLSQKGVQTLLDNTLRSSWMIRPQEVADSHKVEELYKRLDRQLKSLTQTLESVGQSGSEAYRAVSNMSQNIDFLQQLNQMYAYVQLPLRLQQGRAHGELYVYTNKRNLAAKDGKVSALLHLDMEHLGPVDVYVALQNSKVSTKFYVADDEMLDFLEAHMELLTERLQRRGYDCSFSMETRGEKGGSSPNSGLLPVLQQEKGMVLSQYAFDVRT